MEISQNVNNRPQTLCDILPMVTVDIVINSTRGVQHFMLHPAGTALPSRWCFWFLLLFSSARLQVAPADESSPL